MHESFGIFNVSMWWRCDGKFVFWGGFEGTKHTLSVLAKLHATHCSNIISPKKHNEKLLQRRMHAWMRAPSRLHVDESKVVEHIATILKSNLRSFSVACILILKKNTNSIDHRNLDWQHLPFSKYRQAVNESVCVITSSGESSQHIKRSSSPFLSSSPPLLLYFFFRKMKKELRKYPLILER